MLPAAGIEERAASLESAVPGAGRAKSGVEHNASEAWADMPGEDGFPEVGDRSLDLALR